MILVFKRRLQIIFAPQSGRFPIISRFGWADTFNTPPHQQLPPPLVSKQVVHLLLSSKGIDVRNVYLLIFYKL